MVSPHSSRTETKISSFQSLTAKSKLVVIANQIIHTYDLAWASLQTKLTHEHILLPTHSQLCYFSWTSKEDRLSWELCFGFLFMDWTKIILSPQMSLPQEVFFSTYKISDLSSRKFLSSTLYWLLSGTCISSSQLPSDLCSVSVTSVQISISRYLNHSKLLKA